MSRTNPNTDLGLGITTGSSPLIFTHFAGLGSGAEPVTQNVAIT